jgi:hypothetical protein
MEITETVKIRAGMRVRNSVYDGRLKKNPCKVCGNPKSEGH